MSAQNCIGVIDLDSPILNGFTKEDRFCVEQVAAMLSAGCDW